MGKTYITIKGRKQWQVPTGHRQDRKHTIMDSRPKRQRTRKNVIEAHIKEYQ